MTSVPSVNRLLDLSGRTVIVTGASGGIGSGIARRMAEAGADVVCHYNGNRSGADAVVADIERKGGKAVAAQADIATAPGVAALLDQTLNAFGRVHAVVNNAGHQPVEALIDISEESWTKMMAVNAGGPFLLTRAFAEHVRVSKTGGGSVVNIASIEGHNPAPGHGHYATSKAALLMFTKAAALEFGSLGIRVNAICPGLIHRDGIEQGWPEGVGRWKKAAPLGRLGQPDDIADAALFLISDAARWITGADLIVDGGVSTHPTW